MVGAFENSLDTKFPLSTIYSEGLSSLCLLCLKFTSLLSSFLFSSQKQTRKYRLSGGICCPHRPTAPRDEQQLAPHACTLVLVIILGSPSRLSKAKMYVTIPLARYDLNMKCWSPKDRRLSPWHKRCSKVKHWLHPESSGFINRLAPWWIHNLMAPLEGAKS